MSGKCRAALKVGRIVPMRGKTSRIGFASFLMLCGLLLISVPGSEARDKMDGLTLAKKMFYREDGRDAYAMVRMLLIDKRGRKELRSLISARKDYGELSKGYLQFTAPASIKGTTFLYWENRDRDDDQFLYLPALRRVRRIVSRQKDSRFVNTDYTYEDMQKRRFDKDHHKILRSEKFGKYPCWVLESVPKKRSSSQYGKRISWVVKNIYVPIKIEFYDRRGRLKKISRGYRLRKIQGIWTVMESEMKDLKRRHRTLMKNDKIRYNTGIPDRVFTRRYLERKR